MTTGDRPGHDTANRLEQVRRIRVSSPLLDPAYPLDRPDPRPRVHVGQAGPAGIARTRLRPAPRQVVAGGAALALLAALLVLDGTIALTVVLLGLTGFALGALARRATSFSAGFLGYRPDDGWPRGVQEQYEVKFHFR